jgi:hypothetical protein
LLSGRRRETGCGEEHDSCNGTHFYKPAKNLRPPPR